MGNNMTGDQVWSFGFDEVAGFTVGRDVLDGDPVKIEYIDTTFDFGLSPTFEPGDLYAGRAVKQDNVSTRVEWSSKKHPPYDVFMVRGLILVSDAFKDIIERLEPNVHQFFPVEVLYKDGSHARQMYFFNICNRLDTMDRERATANLDRIMWDPASGDFVFSKSLIGNHHIWKDKFIHPGKFLSDTVKSEIEKIGLTGITFHGFPAY